MAFVEDLDQFFEEKDFAIPATFTRGTATIAECMVNFDATVDTVQVESAEIATDAPSLLTKTANVVGVRKKDVVALAGKTYKVRFVLDDGTGVTRIDLEIF